MRTAIRFPWRLTLLITAVTAAPAPAQQTVAPPTRRAVVVDTVHGVAIADPYRWLEQQDAPETRAWIDAQNVHTGAVIGALPGREAIERRLSELLRVQTINIPLVRGGRYFLSKRAADQNLTVLYMRRSLNGPDEVLVDPHGWSADHTVSAGFWDVSHDGRLLAYGVRSGGEDEVRIFMMDIDTRRLVDSLPRARYGGFSFTRDKRGAYYARHTPAGPRVFFHAIGAAGDDRLVFGEGYGPDKLIGANLSLDRRYLRIAVYHGSSGRTELWIQDLDRGTPVTPIVRDIDARFSSAYADNRLFVWTDWNAPNSRVFSVDLRRPAREEWREIIPEGHAPIGGVSAVGGKLFVTYLDSVRSKVRIFDPEGRVLGEIALPAIGSTFGVSGDWDRAEAFYAFSSFAQPNTIYRYDTGTGAQEVWARLAVPVSNDPVEVRQVWYPSRDGTRVPMFVAHRRGLRLDGRNPTLLTGYGGFNLNQLPGFSARAAFWIENGGVYALANLRGGGEFGEAWHRAGMLERKQNGFDDFIAAAEWLIANRYTSPERLAISGGSNGGLLVGAAMTQRPALFRAVVCTNPLLDMVRYHRFLVAGYWVPEYGTADSAAHFPYLQAYSPYHRVRDGERYPAVLFVTGDADTRVDPLHARKMTARVQAATASGRPVLLRYHARGGHSGGRPLSASIGDLAEQMLFLFWQLGVSGPGAARSGR